MQILNDENLFFGLFLVIFFMGWLLRGFYGRKSPDYRKSFTELKRQPLEYESHKSLALLSLYGLILFAALVIYVFFTPQFYWMQLPLIAILRWAGVIVGMCCLPLIAWVQWTLGASSSKTLTIQDDHKLVKTGPYSRIRHPMYLVHTFWFLSWFIVSTNLLFAIS
jgi:protein-S-isoprenylcysteine O-methyltransferase Ste14